MTKLEREMVDFLQKLIVQSDKFDKRSPSAERHYRKAKLLIAKAKTPSEVK